MKSLIPFLFLNLFLVAQADAQTPTEISYRPYFWDTEQEEEGHSNYQEISMDNQTVAYRKYFSATNIVNEEYLLFSKDTFIYNVYTQTQHLPITSGKVIPNRCCERIDSIITFDPETFSEHINIIRYNGWSKEGFWKETVDGEVEEGFYRNNHRIGNWVCKSKNKTYSYDSKGKLVKEDFYNMIAAKQEAVSLAVLTKKWNYDWTDRVESSTKMKISLSNKFTKYNNTWTFEKDNTLIVTGYQTVILTGKWTLQDYNHITIEGIGEVKENCEILQLSDDRLIIEFSQK